MIFQVSDDKTSQEHLCTSHCSCLYLKQHKMCNISKCQKKIPAPTHKKNAENGPHITKISIN